MSRPLDPAAQLVIYVTGTGRAQVITQSTFGCVQHVKPSVPSYVTIEEADDYLKKALQRNERVNYHVPAIPVDGADPWLRHWRDHRFAVESVERVPVKRPLLEVRVRMTPIVESNPEVEPILVWRHDGDAGQVFKLTVSPLDYARGLLVPYVDGAQAELKFFEGELAKVGLTVGTLTRNIFESW
jgi:hypothetical protein